MATFFKKFKKPYFRVILRNIFQILGKNNFLKKRALSVYKYSKYLPWYKKYEKSNKPFPINIPKYCWTERGQWFYRKLRRTGVQKKNIFGTEECDSFWEGKNNCKLNNFRKTMVHRSNIHYYKINQKRKLKRVHKISSGTIKNETSQPPILSSPLKRVG